MPSSAVLDRESTSSGSTRFAHNVLSAWCYNDANRVRRYPDADWDCALQGYVPSQTNLCLPIGKSAFAKTVIGELLEEESQAALSGTGALGSNPWMAPLYLIACELLATGIGDGTQYLLKVERMRAPLPSEAPRRSPDARELTRRALDLSGLTREQLAFAMGVRRQSVQNWLRARGGMSPDNRQRLQDLVVLFERAQRRLGSARQVSNWLTTPVQETGDSPLEMLANSEIDAVRGRLLRRTPARRPAITPIQAPRSVPRRVATTGQSPPWSQRARSQHFDPEEGDGSLPVGEPAEPYRNAASPQVTGLSRA
jgi:hypothetical protein